MNNRDASLRGLTSVVTASFNAVDHIEHTVRSVAQQSCMPLEHIVVDDGSTDGTVSLLRRLKAEVPGLRIIAQDNEGAGPARNKGIEVARGRYIAFIDSDDIWLPDKLACQIGFMQETGATFTYGEYDVVDSGTQQRIGHFEPPESLSYSDLLTKCPIACSTVAYDQDVLGKVFMPAIRRGQDWGLWLSLTRNGETAERYPGRKVIYYVSKNSLSSKKMAKAIDMFHIYYDEEKFGFLRSIWLLAQHAVSAYMKRPILVK